MTLELARKPRRQRFLCELRWKKPQLLAVERPASITKEEDQELSQVNGHPVINASRRPQHDLKQHDLPSECHCDDATQQRAV